MSVNSMEIGVYTGRIFQVKILLFLHDGYIEATNIGSSFRIFILVC
jgi:hypothetical protein